MSRLNYSQESEGRLEIGLLFDFECQHHSPIIGLNDANAASASAMKASVYYKITLKESQHTLYTLFRNFSVLLALVRHKQDSFLYANLPNAMRALYCFPALLTHFP